MPSGSPAADRLRTDAPSWRHGRRSAARLGLGSMFHKEIDTEIVTMQAEAADAYQASLAADARFADLPALRERIAAQEAIVASGGVADPGLAVVRDEVTARQAAYDQAVG